MTALVRDLERETFRRGDLARRLTFANLPKLGTDDQVRLGVAVARRASRGTFVVADDGVEAVRPEDTVSWPPAYVEAFVMGLFFDPNGYLHLGEWPIWTVRQSARLIAALPHPLPIQRRLAERAAKARTSRAFATDEDRERAVAESEELAPAMLDGKARALWLEIAQALKGVEASD